MTVAVDAGEEVIVERKARKARKPRAPKLHPAEQYLADIRDGKIVTSKYVKLAVDRHFRDLDEGHKRGLVFNPDAAKHCIDFFPAFLTHFEGDWAGKPFELTPSQQAKTWILYGWQRSNGLRRFKYAYDEEGRGNGKSVYASGLCIYELVAFGEAGPWVYSGATDKKTARLVWDTADLMVKANPELRDLIESRPGIANMHIAGTAAKFEAVASDDSNLLGLRPQFTLLDELHEHKSAGVWNVFTSAMGKRRQPLLLAITNSGFDRNSVCWQKREYSVNVLEGIFEDDVWFAWIQGIDDEDDWEDESCWIKANPNLGTIVQMDELREQARIAKNDPSALNSFLRFRLSRWTEGDITAAIPMQHWDKCRGAVDLEDLKGRLCIGALDLSSTNDISALGLVFPPTATDDKWRLLPRFYLPEEAIQERVKRDRIPYDQWAREGLFTLTPGRVVDYGYIRRDVQQMAEQFELKEICFDRWNSTDLVRDLETDGFTMIKWGQGFNDMNAPTRRFIDLVLTEDIAHGGNPVLRWMARNLVVFMDPAGNLKPDKSKSRDKIDGIVALIMALGRAMLVAEPQYTSTFVGSV